MKTGIKTLQIYSTYLTASKCNITEQDHFDVDPVLDPNVQENCIDITDKIFFTLLQTSKITPKIYLLLKITFYY